MTDNNNTQSALNRLSENCMLVSIRAGIAGQTYTSDRASEDVAMVNNADKRRIKTQVLKFTNADLKPCRKERDDAKSLLNAVTVPWDGHGGRIIQVKTYQNIKDRLANHRARFYDLRDEFIKGYEGRVEVAREELTDLFDERRFPHPDEVSEQFYFDIKTDVISDPNDIRISGAVELIEEVRDEMKQRQVRKLNESKQEVIDRMVDRLKKSVASVQNLHAKKQAGEETKFFDSSVTGVLELVGTIEDINITKDPNLTVLGDRATEIFSKHGRYTTDLIKSSPEVREEVIEETSDLISAIEQYTPNTFKTT